MSKKKIVSLIAAAAVVVGVAGGTLAWFEASDTEVNNFTTGLVNIDVQEDWRGDKANWLPGDKVEKRAWVRNIGKSDALVKATIEIKVLNEDGTELSPEMAEVFTPEFIEKNIELQFADVNIKNEATKPTEHWMPGVEDTDAVEEAATYYTAPYYYLTKLNPERNTHPLLSNVKLLETAENEWVGKKIQVKVVGEAIQATNGAHEQWQIDNEAVKAIYDQISPKAK
ncbi:BsaA family SipW-dependent biofilm matrix protein [Clostridium chauvoei]|uniref:Camelysin metallo-endopeptidase n=3 Tax=Clostridium chauvoei TaxID=46867 RepID=A0A1U6IYK6_9CLOT|nr:BsaA family SipW-dependent biofilm matrix protein [Clostridium chauvoei]ATD54235.1 hypothetical protein BTM20_02885 [Clostridium chauvoei]ATD58085.1 hypothetical protein BTM21_10195 [Clostridium chauvoei]MBX7279841.1 BsaA family SipW-dependent biofilm matrix protein [Clostridium chauvoei]MBX7282241.1 BsaA family SipW-dependent biofilm matrix protein [Clostridium chauvoei]MBX7284731.1 BsaA family SipW-dependent biofilm matrix protein [Clostridium chauvoei]